MGTVYSRKRSPYLWIKYYQHGRPVRESTGTKNETVARRMLRAREGDVERGIPIDPKVGRITFHEAAKDMLERLQGRIENALTSIQNGGSTSTSRRSSGTGGCRRSRASDIRAYIAKRLADTYLAHPARRVKRRNGTSQELPEVRRPVSVGEINRELTVLKRMFSLAIEAGKLHHKPHFADAARGQRPCRLLRTRAVRGRACTPAGGHAAGRDVRVRHRLADQQRGACRSSGGRSTFASARFGSIQGPRRIERGGCST